MICMAGLVNIVMVYTRNLREFAAVGIWTLFAVAVSNNGHSDGKKIVYACYIVIFIIACFIVHNGLKSRERSVDSM